ncbi:MAG: DJ-1/PfpI family protein [Elusimicrobiaceae bacterium]|nr:DJ-1/PfpI family protein [Elusimicrobiaceae bacterium]
MKKVCLVLTDGFEELEAVGTFAILSRAGLTVDIFSLTQGDATGRFGLACTALKPFATLNGTDYDALVLPGGPQYSTLKKSEGVQALIKEFVEGGKVVAAICASPTILGHAGYLKGKKYTCFTAMNEDFGGHFTGEYATTDGNIITGQSAAATIDFGFAIVEKLLGKEKAEQVKKSIYYKK